MTQNLFNELFGKTVVSTSGTEEEQEAARLILAFEVELMGKGWGIKAQELEPAKAILNAPERVQIQVLFAMQAGKHWSWLMGNVKSILLSRNLPWTAAEIEKLVKDG